MRILITGGGTCGHIFPGIAIANSLKKINSNNDILFIGGKGKMEIDIIREAGYPIAEIWIDGFNRRNLLKNLLLPFKLLYSFWKSKKILKYFNPDIVIGTGGYVSYPVLASAVKMNIPIVIQEQNSTLGLTNKLFLKSANKIFLSYPQLFEKLNKTNNNIILAGNPIRESILSSRIGKRRAIQSFNLDPQKKVILVLGGSLGAQTINSMIAKNLGKFQSQNVQVIWQTGKYYFDNIIKKKFPKEAADFIKPFDFIKDLSYAYAAADIVIARAGALTISELAFKKKPIILLPSPNVTNNHQVKNVMELQRKNAAEVIYDKNASKELIDKIFELLNDTDRQKELSKNISEFANSDSSKIIAEEILKIPHNIKGLSNIELLKKYKYAYFIGIGGIGMSSLAQWFAKNGIQVFGYDKTPSQITTKLKDFNISTGFEDNIRFIPRTVLDNIRQTIVIYTPAIPKDNQILNYIQEKEYAVFKRSEILGKITSENFLIAFAGTHGKTTTAALLTHILYSAGRNMISFIGAVLKGYNSNFIALNDKNPNAIAIAEADEFDKSFLKLHPNISVIGSVDVDHIDIYKDKDTLKKSYIEFINLTHKEGKLLIEENAFKELYKRAKLPIDLENKIIRYSMEEKTDVTAQNIRFFENYVQFDYIRPDLAIKDIKLSLQGYHNVENALAAITIATLLGINIKNIVDAMSSFPGIERRFEYIIKSKTLTFINDYAHHPQEVMMLIKSVKALYPGKNITIIFQPHLYSRTQQFAKEFGSAFSTIDELYLLPIYPAREEQIKNVSSKMIFSKVKLKNKHLIEKEELLARIGGINPEVLLTVGAGDINDLVPIIKKKLNY